MLAELVTGREAAIPLALDQGVPPAWVALTSIVQNLALACLVVPLVMTAVRQAEQGGSRIAKALSRLHEAAERQKHKAASAGGIFLFMLVPFLANGPVIAGILGRLLGIDYRRLAVAIAFAVVITATAWSFGYAALTSALATVDPGLARVPTILALAVTAFAVLRLAWGLRPRRAN